MTQRHILQWHILERRQNRQDYELREWHESLSQTLFEKFVQFVVHIIKFNVQTSMFKGKKVHIIKFKAQCSMFKVQCSKFNVQCSMFNVQCSMFKVQSSKYKD